MHNNKTTALWQKTNSQTDTGIMDFMAGDDIVLDRVLLPYDICASKAHVQSLQRIGILSAQESERLSSTLDQCLADFQDGKFELEQPFEDGHSAIEWYLTDKLGELGKKVHTGRSRNDQVLVATRLWLKEQLKQLHALCFELAGVFLKRAEFDDQPMPGYTHMQRAVVSSTGLWCAGFAEAMLDNVQLVADTLRLIDSNPLGTAAGYGVNLPLDRSHTTATLGFARIQVNPIYTQNSRGKLELHGLNALHQVLLDVRRLAWDFNLFCSNEFDFVILPDVYTTGSSIMPNKRNPDYIELLRAAPAVCQGAICEINALLSLPSGYQRDLQNSKAPLLRSFKHGLAALGLLAELIRNFKWKSTQLMAALEPAMLATDWAIDQAADGVPFREAYQAVAEQLNDITEIKMSDAGHHSLSSRISPGACGALQLDILRSRLDDLNPDKV